MTRLPALLPLALLTAACVATTPAGTLRAVPEEVTAIAAPFQDLNAVVLRPEDGCYWYWHDGPVERTLIPLRDRSGNRICTEAPSAEG